jgi:uncharacterized membrane protein YdbT with pleckstrin-like domain
MSYVQSSLSKGETVVYTAKLHWIIFLWPSVFLLLSLMSMKSSGAFTFFLILTILYSLISYVNYVTSEFAITTKRVVMKTGIIRRNSEDVLLAKIEGAQVNQGILGRIFNYGTILIGGTGGSRKGFKCIAKPIEFRKFVQDQTDTSSVGVAHIATT